MSNLADHDRAPARDAENCGWARGVLGLPDDATAAQQWAAVAARLEEAQFVPPPQWEQAIFLLADQSPPGLTAHHADEVLFRPREVLLKAEVDRLAERFFTLPVAERRACWLALARRCAFSLPLAARLQALAAGLDAVPPPVADGPSSPVSLLVLDICRAFVLPPSQRAACHEEIIWRAAGEPRVWQSAGRELRQRFPQIVPLAPALIETLPNFIRVRKADDKAAAKRRAAAPPAIKRTKQRSRGWVWLGPAIFVLLQLARFIPSSSPPANFTTAPRTTFTDAERRTMFRPVEPPPTRPYTIPEASSFGPGLRQPAQPGPFWPPEQSMFPRKSSDQGGVDRNCEGRSSSAAPPELEIVSQNGTLVIRRRPHLVPAQNLTVPIPGPPTAPLNR